MSCSTRWSQHATRARPPKKSFSSIPQSPWRVIASWRLILGGHRMLAVLPRAFHQDFQTCEDARLEHNLATIFAAFELGKAVGRHATRLTRAEVRAVNSARQALKRIRARASQVAVRRSWDGKELNQAR